MIIFTIKQALAVSVELGALVLKLDLVLAVLMSCPALRCSKACSFLLILLFQGEATSQVTMMQQQEDSSSADVESEKCETKTNNFMQTQTLHKRTLPTHDEDLEKFQAEENYVLTKDDILKIFDHDKDGELSSAEMNAALDKYDRNGNGYFEKDELASSLVQYNRTKAKVNASEYSQVMVNASHSSRDARGALRLRLNLDNGHPHEGTSNNICVAMYQIRDDATHGDEFCASPGNTNWWRPTDGYYPMSGDDFFTLTIDGNNAALIDQIIIERCWAGFEDATGTCIWPASEEVILGSDNNIGWCLSQDPGDHTAFGSQAYQSKCCTALRIQVNHTSRAYQPGDGTVQYSEC